ncbi:MAG: dephospho-CoA kinase [Thermofilum sp. ex4484_82]|nr:MAG: dephospho-CoA kinase [Thermofilum sp. ex4484_82]OYT39504.1 MAG: dephospho-CoA kinase [Archaeoglobales archaeon ex4484_92]
MNSVRLILLTGMPGAGKSLVSKGAELLEIPVLTMGDIVREETEKRKLKPTPENTGLVAKKLREEYGKDIIAKLIFKKILNQKYEVVLIDGLRSLYELDFFKKSAKDITLIAIHASPKTRFQRLRNRNREDDPKTWEEFCNRDRRELEFGIGSVIALADIMIVNENISKNELLEKVCKILKEVARK